MRFAAVRWQGSWNLRECINPETLGYQLTKPQKGVSKDQIGLAQLVGLLDPVDELVQSPRIARPEYSRMIPE